MKSRLFFFALLAVAALISPCFAQSAAVVTIELKDVTGAVVWGTDVSVLAKSQRQTISKVARTDVNGTVTLDMEPGTYDLAVKAKAFRAVTKQVVITSTDRQTFAFTLQVDGCPPGLCVEVEPMPLPNAGADSCPPADIEKYGRPVMFVERDGVAYGVSTTKHDFKSSESAKVHIWLSNHTPHPIQTWGCCEQTFTAYVNVFDSSGHRIPTNFEVMEPKARDQGRELIQVCSCASPITDRPPGFCGVIDSGTLNRPDTYDLKPGRYTITERHRGDYSQQRNETTPLSPNLAISIED